MRKFEYFQQAIQEASYAYHWYDERSEAAAEQFWRELCRARQSAAEHPESGIPYLHGTRCQRLRHFPYGLVYIERAELVLGVAVAHLKRRPGYWSERLAE